MGVRARETAEGVMWGGGLLNRSYDLQLKDKVGPK